MRKRCLCLTTAACLALPLAAQPEGYPSRPIRSVMTVSGGADIVARLVAQGLSGTLGQPVVVETLSGAGGAIGADAVARAAPDGHTIMLTSASALVMNRFLSRSARLDPLKDFTPITKAFETVAIVVTSPALPVASMRELIDYAKRHPGKLSYGTSGIGTTHHLAGESIRLLTGIDWVHVPYKGGPPVITALVAGDPRNQADLRRSACSSSERRFDHQTP
jgi:tripartite-type tricarboxylate transporter receptor subunit TctC